MYVSLVPPFNTHAYASFIKLAKTIKDISAWFETATTSSKKCLQRKLHAHNHHTPFLFAEQNLRWIYIKSYLSIQNGYFVFR